MNDPDVRDARPNNGDTHPKLCNLRPRAARVMHPGARMHPSGGLPPHARWLPAILLLCLLTAGWMQGCRDDVVPAEGLTVTRTITVLARQFNPATGAYDLPAPGARIVIRSVTADGEKEFLTLVSDAEGVARYAGSIPAAGLNLRISGEFRGQRQYTSPPVILFCDDVTTTMNFDAEPVQSICCPPPAIDALVVFFDEEYDTQLIQNTPLAVGKYFITRTLFTNGCPDADITVVVPPMLSPFSIVRMETGQVVTGTRITIKPGERFTVQFAASTAQIGVFREFVEFGLECADGSASHIRVELQATVIELPCDCEKDSVRTIVPEPESLPVGSVRTYNPIHVLDVPANCGPVVITNVEVITANRAWDLKLPALPVTIQPGGSFDVGADFRPWRADSTQMVFRTTYRLADGRECHQLTRLMGRACHEMCPLVVDTVRPREFNAATPHDVLVGEVSGRVEFSPALECSSLKNSVTTTISILLPDTACCTQPMPFDVSVVDVEPARVSSAYFTVMPASRITLERGVRQRIEVTFTAPTVAEFAEIFSSGRRTATGSRADSTFSLRIHLTGSTCRSCEQWIDVRAVVTRLMQLSPIRNLRAYGQRTDLVPVAPAEVSHIESVVAGELEPGLVHSLVRTDRTYPYPPGQYDFFVDVSDTSRAYPPLPSKLPMLFHATGTSYTKIQRIRTGYLERDFEQVIPIIRDLQADFLANPTLFLQPSLSWTFPGTPATNVYPQPGDVFVMYTDTYWPSARGTSVPCKAALMYVRRVDNGQQNDTNHQSGIEFRLIHPIVLY